MCCAAGPHLTDALLEEVLALADRTDSVELTLCLPDPDRHVAVRSLDIDVLDAAIRQVYFFDTPDLQCNGAGVAVRARRLQGRGDDSMIKLRPVVPDDLPPELRRSRDLVVEIDVLPQAFVCSASLQNAQPDGAVREVLHGTGGIRTLFSKDQLAFFREHAPAGITINDLSPLGPITVLEVTYRPDELVRPFVAELWMYPDGTRILELSTTCPPAAVRQVAADTRAYLAGCGVHLSEEQQARTTAALELFSAELGGPL